MMKKLIVTSLYVCMATFAVAQAKQVDLKALDNYLEKMTANWDVPSMSIGIVKDGKLVFSKGYGVKEVGKKAKPDKNTLYAIASNSKAFTSAIIAQLVQEGKLDWNDKVVDYLSYFEMSEPWITNHVTIRDLLSHRVGLGTFSGDVIWYKSGLTPKEIIERIKNIPPAYDFRAGWGYSNLMYITAGEVIREVTGKSWAENVKERIFLPLEMDRSITSPNNLDGKGNFATPHARRADKNIPIVWEDWETIGALGGVISSVEDISKWMIFNMNHGINGERYVAHNPFKKFNVDASQ